MTDATWSTVSVHRLLCRIMGGQDQAALQECVDSGLVPALVDMARADDVLPALAVRCHEQGVGSDTLGAEAAAVLKSALLDNTRRNMRLIAQALKLGRRLNEAGITPLFLKGTARLLQGSGRTAGFRKQVDIDLVVKPEELVTAGDALLEDGYTYREISRDKQTLLPGPVSTAEALRLSAAHHHLPPLLKEGYDATVELHRHYLPGRFQRGNPLEPLFASARTIESQGVTIKMPSTEDQLVHMVLGTLVNDGYLARRSFPVREACDLIDMLEQAEKPVALDLVSRRCGRHFELFCSLVSRLMGYPSGLAGKGDKATDRYIWMMGKRYDSKVAHTLLDVYARIEYLAYEMAFSPAKLPAYLGRMISPK